MASTEVLGEPRTPDSASLERDVLESETIAGEGAPEDLLNAMTRTVATQVIDDTQSTTHGERYAVTHADAPTQVSAAASPSALESPSSPGPATRIEVHRSKDPDDRAGDIIHDRYQLVRMLGKGGMGTVYIGQHTKLPKTFAVKVLNPRYAKRRDIAQRFLQESQAVSMIQHENVVSVIDYGTEDDGTSFLVMEHLRGEPLSALCKREAPLPWKRVKHIMDQLCRALQAAHDVGIVHRDVKPENVLRVGRHNDPDYIKVLDFGLAKMQVSGGLRLTQTGMVLGTPDYMSPEQARGRPTDHRADIYASGVMMYELLCGKVPFRAKTFRAMRDKHLLEQPEPPSRKAPDAGITEEMDAIVLRALAKDPDHRFVSMSEMAQAIADVGTGKSTVALIERPTMPLLTERNLVDRMRPGSAPGARGATLRGGTLPMGGVPKSEPGSTPSSAREFSRAPTQPKSEPPAPRPPSLASEPAPARGGGVGLYLGLAALVIVLALAAWAVLVGPLAQPAPAPAPAPAAPPASAEQRPPSHATVRFETNVPVKVLDADGVPRFGDELRDMILVPRAEQPIQLLLRAEGYRDLQVAVTPDRDQVLRYQLEPLFAPTTAADEPEPEPEPKLREAPKQPADDQTPTPPAPEPEPPAADTQAPADDRFAPGIKDPFGK